MNTQDQIFKPSKDEQIAALESFDILKEAIDRIRSEDTEIEIAETKERIKLPLSYLKLLARILEVTGQGRPISIVPVATEMTTQAAADLLGCSRPHFVKLLENGLIPFVKIGKHRRVKYEDVMAYRSKMKEEQKQYLIRIMQADEKDKLYDI